MVTVGQPMVPDMGTKPTKEAVIAQLPLEYLSICSFAQDGLLCFCVDLCFFPFLIGINDFILVFGRNDF